MSSIVSNNEQTQPALKLDLISTSYLDHILKSSKFIENVFPWASKDYQRNRANILRAIHTKNSDIDHPFGLKYWFLQLENAGKTLEAIENKIIDIVSTLEPQQLVEIRQLQTSQLLLYAVQTTTKAEPRTKGFRLIIPTLIIKSITTRLDSFSTDDITITEDQPLPSLPSPTTHQNHQASNAEPTLEASINSSALIDLATIHKKLDKIINNTEIIKERNKAIIENSENIITSQQSLLIDSEDLKKLQKETQPIIDNIYRKATEQIEASTGIKSKIESFASIVAKTPTTSTAKTPTLNSTRKPKEIKAVYKLQLKVKEDQSIAQTHQTFLNFCVNNPEIKFWRQYIGKDKIILTFCNQQDLDKARNIIEPHYNTDYIAPYQPQFTIVIDSSYPEDIETITKGIKQANQNLNLENLKVKTTYVFKTARGKSLRKIICETDKPTRENIDNLGSVNLFGNSCPIKHHFPVRICSNCQQLGHNKSRCTAERFNIQDKSKCGICLKLKQSATHKFASLNCPEYCKEIKKLVNNTDYDLTHHHPIQQILRNAYKQSSSATISSSSTQRRQTHDISNANSELSSVNSDQNCINQSTIQHNNSPARV